jgi:hypothetical protein
MGKRTDTSNDVGGILSAASPRETVPPPPAIPGGVAAAPSPAFNANAFGAVLRKALIGF